MAERKYWLFKSEPGSYSFSDLLAEEDQTAEWDGVRNYQARNFMRDQMKVGDGVFFYHSSSGEPAVVGTAQVAKESHPDEAAWDPKDKHYDPKSTPDKPVWFLVDIKAESQFARQVTLKEIKENPRLQDMMLVRRGMRLSIQPVTQQEWDEIVSLGSG